MYIPKPTLVGIDPITHRIGTTTGVCETATVSITVLDQNARPRRK